MAKDTNLYMFLTGLGVGAVGALLLAPAAGYETRSKVLSAANGAGDRIKEGLARGSDFLDEGLSRGSALLDQGLAKGADVADDFRNKVNDTLATTTDASKKAMDASKQAVDDVVGQSKDFAHSTGRGLETAGQKLQQV